MPEKKKVKKKDDSTQSAYATHALSGIQNEKDPKSGTTVPTEQQVKNAKDFVDKNKK